MSDRIIVSRHPAAVKFIGRAIHPDWHAPVMEDGALVWRPVGLEPEDPEFHRVYDSIPVLASAGPDDVRGKIVYGNLPLHLSSLARAVWAVEFAGDAPRGAEYTLADMEAAGARLAGYVVRPLTRGRPIIAEPIPDDCLPPPATIDRLLRGSELDADGRIVGGVWDGESAADVLADYEEYRRQYGE